MDSEASRLPSTHCPAVPARCRRLDCTWAASSCEDGTAASPQTECGRSTRKQLPNVDSCCPPAVAHSAPQSVLTGRQPSEAVPVCAVEFYRRHGSPRPPLNCRFESATSELPMCWAAEFALALMTCCCLNRVAGSTTSWRCLTCPIRRVKRQAATQNFVN